MTKTIIVYHLSKVVGGVKIEMLIKVKINQMEIKQEENQQKQKLKNKKA